jgi:hypothetical protein
MFWRRRRRKNFGFDSILSGKEALEKIVCPLKCGKHSSPLLKIPLPFC